MFALRTGMEIFVIGIGVKDGYWVIGISEFLGQSDISYYPGKTGYLENCCT